MTYDLIIVGGGPAGLTAGLYGARAGMRSLLLETALPGGQAASTDIIENYPGFPEGIAGPELMARFEEQARRFGLEIAIEEVKGVALSGPEKVISTGGGEQRGRTVILACGAQPRLLGVPGEERLRGRGVSYCATCDGAFFRNKRVAVVGGGDSAVTEGLFLTRFASQVVIIHRRDSLRAARVLQDRAHANPKVEFRWNTVVEEVQGAEKVESLRLRDVKTGQEKVEPMDGVFVFVGTQPNTTFLNGLITLDPAGYVVTNDGLGTSQPGVFAAGDVRHKDLRQVSTAVGDGAQAAMAAERYLADQEKV